MEPRRGFALWVLFWFYLTLPRAARSAWFSARLAAQTHSCGLWRYDFSVAKKRKNNQMLQKDSGDGLGVYCLPEITPVSMKVYDPRLEAVLTKWNVKPCTLIGTVNEMCCCWKDKPEDGSTWRMISTKESWWDMSRRALSLLARNSQSDMWEDNFLWRFYVLNQKEKQETLALPESIFQPLDLNHDKIPKSQVVTKSFMWKVYDASEPGYLSLSYLLSWENGWDKLYCLLPLIWY